MGQRRRQDGARKSLGWVSLMIACLVVCVTSLSSQAEQVTVGIQATVTSVMDAQGFLGGCVFAGSQVTGTYTYDTTAAVDSFPALPNYAAYSFPVSPVGFDLKLCGFRFTTDQVARDFTVYVNNDVDHDFLGFYSFQNIFDVYALLPTFPTDVLDIQNVVAWALMDNTRRALVNDALPLLAPEPNAFEDVNNLVIQSVARHAYYSISAHVDQAFIGDPPRRRRGGR